MRATTGAAVAAALGSDIASHRSIGGGSINEAFACLLSDGRDVFVKTNRGTDPRMFPCEARGLAWLAEANAVRVPKVLAVNDVDAGEQLLVLELLVAGRRQKDYEERLGRGLARLHRFGAPSFGFFEDNFLATLAQDNSERDDWASFYVEQRLEPLVRRAVDHGHVGASWPRKFDRIFANMAQLAGPAEPPARLHGDLWSGNLHADAAGGPVILDPAVYGGHREIDLAMLRLFGSPSPRFFDAYDEVYPRAPGHADRVKLYQLYPLLAHVNLFGGGYVGSTEAALAAY